MRQAKAFLLLLFIGYLTPSIHAQSSPNSSRSKADSLHHVVSRMQLSVDSLAKTINQAEYDNRALEQERMFLAQKQATYDMFLTVLEVIIGAFGVATTIALLTLGWLGYQNISQLKDQVHKDLERDFSDQAQRIVRETMRSTYEKPIADLVDQVNTLENALGADILKKNEVSTKPKKRKQAKTTEAATPPQNLFDEAE